MNWTRREFLQKSVITSTALLLPTTAWGDEKSTKPITVTEPLSASGLETLFLTWADDPLTTMRVQWIVPSSSQPRPISVQITPPSGGPLQIKETTQRKFGPFDFWVHRADFSGLNPDTLYQLQVGSLDKIGTFLTAPAILQKPLVFAEGGDVGTKLESVQPLHQMAASWDPLFALIIGDHSYSNGRDINLELQYLKLWRSNMVTASGRLIPMIAGIGNHEVIGGYKKTSAEAPFFYALFEGLFKEQGAYGTLDFGAYLSLILLDSGHTCEVAAQNEWLQKTLADRKAVPHCFVGYHVPAYPSVRKFSEELSVEIRKNWVPLIETSSVRTVFEQHDHAFKRTKPLRGGVEASDGVTFIGDGAWGRDPRVVKPLGECPYLLKSAPSLNVWRVTLDSKTQKFWAGNEKRGMIDQFEQPIH